VSAVHRVLSLGAGVQSTTLYLMAGAGLVPQPKVAIFADTGSEPMAVYEHLHWLQFRGGEIPIWIDSAGNLGEDLRRKGEGRVASLPCFTKGDGDPTEGRIRRQCTQDYKLKVIDRSVRRGVLGMNPRQRVPAGVKVIQQVGISLDEVGRANRMLARDRPKWLEFEFPLLDLRMTREECRTWLADRVPHEVPRSACVFCPMHNDAEWLRVMKNPQDWAQAVAVDEALRVPGNTVNRKMNKPMYLHRSCRPLAEVEFKVPTDPREQLNLGFGEECMGMCGV
jgi:hypothetical protein